MSSPSHIPCPSCGYNLRGLLADAGATCPECGQTHTRLALVQHRARLSRRWLGSLAATPFLMILTGAVGWVVARSLEPTLGFLIPILAGLAGFLWVWTNERRAQILSSGPDPKPWEPMLIQLCSIALAAIVTFLAAAAIFAVTILILTIFTWLSR